MQFLRAMRREAFAEHFGIETTDVLARVEQYLAETPAAIVAPSMGRTSHVYCDGEYIWTGNGLDAVTAPGRAVDVQFAEHVLRAERAAAPLTAEQHAELIETLNAARTAILR